MPKRMFNLGDAIESANDKYKAEVLSRPEGAKKPFGGVLNNFIADRGGLFWGHITDDPNERWPDGTWIHTSTIVKKYIENDKKYIETLNTVYELGDKKESK